MKGNRRGPQHKLPPQLVPNPTTPPPNNNVNPVRTDGPRFAQPTVTADPSHFIVNHGNKQDKEAYTILDREKGTLKPRPFPLATDPEPRMSLPDALGPQGNEILKSIKAAQQIVFHALGDTGNTNVPADQSEVTDKLLADFTERDSKNVPSFCYNLGDVVYSFGEDKYYYDQFYAPYRDYPAPIFAIPGNHDGMVAPYSDTPTLQAFMKNFCAHDASFQRNPDAGGLVRTAGRQPGVYFTLEAEPFVRILGVYSNCLEDPGVISSQSGLSQTYPYLTDDQTKFLVAALQRTTKEKFKGAIIIAVHHPPYVAVIPKPGDRPAGKHGGSPLMLEDIDRACQQAKVWPHAVLSGHAHNYQRFTRYLDNRETPFIVAGNGGHAHKRLTSKGSLALRTPSEETVLSNGKDKIIFENYDDGGFGYLRVIVDQKQIRIEYHPASDGQSAKTPDDFVTVDLKSYKLVHFTGTPN
jgi:Calcineurin-like phosphoesterase